MTVQQIATDPVCCGQRPVGRAGQPLVLSCQLCPQSPTYWRRPRATGTGGQQ